MRTHALWIVAVLLLAMPAPAQTPFGMPGGYPVTAGKKVDPNKQFRYRFKASDGKTHPYGWARISGADFNSMGNKLEPGKTYSVWLVRADGTRTGVGGAPHAFTVKENGEGRYQVRLEQDFAIEGYEKMVVYLHPSGDPARTDDLVPVLETLLSDKLPIPKEDK